MHWLDLTIVVVYMLAMLAVGLWLSRGVKGSLDYFLAGRNMPFWAIAMSLVVSDIGALEMIGGTANAYTYGIAQANYEWLGCIPAMLIGALLFVPIYWRSGVYSIPEYLGRRYGAAVQGIQAVIWTVFLGAALGIFFQAAASMFEGSFGWPQGVSIGLTATVVAVYTVGGGLRAVVVTDVVQCVILFIGGLVLSGIGLARVGGLEGLMDGITALGEPTQHHFSLLMPVDTLNPDGTPTGFPWTGVLLGLGLVLSPAYWLGNQAIVQRVLSAKDEWAARASMVLGAGLKTIVPLAFVLPGLLGLLLTTSGTPADHVYPVLIQELLPVGLRGLMYAAFLAALMSSIDSYTNSASTIFVHDVYQRFFVRGGSDRHYMGVGRWVSLSIIVVGVLMVPVVRQYETIYTAFQSFLSYFQGPTLALLLTGLVWRRATPAGGLASLLTGVAAALTMERALGLHFLHTAWWSFVVAMITLVAVSLFTKPLSSDELEGLVVGPSLGTGEEG